MFHNEYYIYLGGCKVLSAQRFSYIKLYLFSSCLQNVHLNGRVRCVLRCFELYFNYICQLNVIGKPTYGLQKFTKLISIDMVFSIRVNLESEATIM